jgi:hypothetical protein
MSQNNRAHISLQLPEPSIATFGSSTVENSQYAHRELLAAVSECYGDYYAS